jgi:hypothetical protein
MQLLNVPGGERPEKWEITLYPHYFTQKSTNVLRFKTQGLIFVGGSLQEIKG